MTTKDVTTSDLRIRKADLLANLTAIGPAPLDTPDGHRREEILADIRNVNAAIKAANITESARAKAAGDQRRARGLAEQRDNLRRAGGLAKDPAVAPPRNPVHNQTLGEFILWSATQTRKAIRKVKQPQPFTMEFATALDRFIDDQATHVRRQQEWAATPEWAATHVAPTATALSDGSDHHYRDNTACPACGTDSTVGCWAERL